MTPQNEHRQSPLSAAQLFPLLLGSSSLSGALPLNDGGANNGEDQQPSPSNERMDLNGCNVSKRKTCRQEPQSFASLLLKEDGKQADFGDGVLVLPGDAGEPPNPSDTYTFALLVVAQPANDDGEERVFTARIFSTDEAIWFVLVQLGGWKRAVKKIGGQVEVRLLGRRSSGSPSAAASPQLLEERALVLLYNAAAKKLSRWLDRYASAARRRDGADQLHHVFIHALARLQAGEIDVVDFTLALYFAHRRVQDYFRKQTRNYQTLDERGGEIANTLGWEDEPEHTPTEPLTQMREELEDIAVHGQTWLLQEAARYVLHCFATETEVTAGGLAHWCKRDPSVGSRSLAALRALLEVRLKRGPSRRPVHRPSGGAGSAT